LEENGYEETGSNYGYRRGYRPGFWEIAAVWEAEGSLKLRDAEMAGKK